MQAGDAGPIKIGTTDDLRSRLANLTTGHYEDLFLVGVVPGGVALEREWHADFAGDRIRGEWFRSSIRLTKAIANAVAGVRVDGFRGDPRYRRKARSSPEEVRRLTREAVDAYMDGDAEAGRALVADLRVAGGLRR